MVTIGMRFTASGKATVCTHRAGKEVPSLLESLYRGGDQSGHDLEHRHKVVELQTVSGDLDHLQDHGVALPGVVM